MDPPPPPGHIRIVDVDVIEPVATTRRYISSKIDALTSAVFSALRDATEKKGHVNCDVLDVPVEAIAGRTMGRG